MDTGMSAFLLGIPCPQQRGADGSRETELKTGRFYPSARRLGREQLLRLLPPFPRLSPALRACPPPPTRCEAAPRPSHAPLPAACAPRIHVRMPPAPQWLRLEEMAHVQPPC